MAWRMDEQLVRGEIDNRTRGRVTGRLWFAGRDEPVTLELEGNAWRDIAGHVLRFTNPTPKGDAAGELQRFAAVQRGAVGDITASRKVKVPDCSIEEMMTLIKARKPFPWHWGNSLYLEWHGEENGRVVIEAAHYQLELDPAAAWTMTETEETEQQEANGRAAMALMERLLGASDAADGEDGDEDEPSAGEALADAEQARMDLLLDRVRARIEKARTAGETPDFEGIMDEERERLRRERGEPEPEPLTPEEEVERAEWASEMNAIVDAAQAEVADTHDPFADDADDDSDDEDEANERWHPLVERCGALRDSLRETITVQRWLREDDASEHPLRELINGVMMAGAKLAGALGSAEDAEDWPPEALFAGGVLVRLKKAREHLCDALAGLTEADEQGLAEANWRGESRRELTEILAEVRRMIAEVRTVLRDAEDGDA